MGKKAEQQRLAGQRKKRRRRIINASALLGAVVLMVGLVVLAQSRPSSVEAASLAFSNDANGDLRIETADLQSGLNYVDYGGPEELLLWTDSAGAIRTSFDTCEECYLGGDVRFALDGDTLICGMCGSTQSVETLGTAGWGGCKPISITTEMRADTDSEVVIPAGVLSYAEDMFAHWDASDFSVSFAEYGMEGAHVH